MKHTLGLLLVGVGLASPMPAQPQQVTLPSIVTPPPWTVNNYPMAGPRMRYQQWFAPSEFTSAPGSPGHPVRITALDLIGGPGGQAGAFVDIEVTLGNGPQAAPSVLMNNNLTNSAAPFPLAPVVVVPRGTGPTGGLHQLKTASSGVSVMSLPFQQDFLWDGFSSVVVDIKLFDNGKGNQQYTYDFQYTFRGQGKTWRLFGFSSDPRAVSIASHSGSGEGIAMQFTYEEGATVSYGSACAGAGGFVPVASTSGGLPFGGNGAWTQVLTMANSQQNAFLLLGASNTTWGPIPLPLDMIIIGGFNCELWTAINCYFPVTTVGGGPGAGSVVLPFPVPPVVLTGLEAYTQWMIIDTGAPGRTVVMSQALRHIFQ